MAQKQNIDFRKMTLQEIKDHISQMNKIASTAKKAINQNTSRFVANELVAIGAGIPASLLFPPAILAAAGAGIAIGFNYAARESALKDVFNQVNNLRARYKIVYRARPGRKQFDLDARRTREKKRRSGTFPHKYFSF